MCKMLHVMTRLPLHTPELTLCPQDNPLHQDARQTASSALNLFGETLSSHPNTKVDSGDT